MNESLILQICPSFPFYFKEDRLAGPCFQQPSLAANLTKLNKRLAEDGLASTGCNFKQDSIIHPKAEFTEMLQYSRNQSIEPRPTSAHQTSQLFSERADNNTCGKSKLTFW